MLLMLNNKYRQRGIGLLELMLSLSIIALLLIMATRYYAGARQGHQVSSAISLIQGIRSAASIYAAGKNNSYADIKIEELTKRGLLPADIAADGKGSSPWGTDVSIAPAGTANDSAMITIASVPGGACETMKGLLANQGTPSAACAAQNAVADFTFTFK